MHKKKEMTQWLYLAAINKFFFLLPSVASCMLGPYADDHVHADTKLLPALPAAWRASRCERRKCRVCLGALTLVCVFSLKHST